MALLQIGDRERRVRNDRAAVVDVGQFALRGPEHVAVVDEFERNAGHSQPGLELHAKGAGIRQAEARRELENLDHRGHSLDESERRTPLSIQRKRNTPAASVIRHAARPGFAERELEVPAQLRIRRRTCANPA